MTTELHIALWGEDNFKSYTPIIASKNVASTNPELQKAASTSETTESNIELVILGPAHQASLIQKSFSIVGNEFTFIEWPSIAKNSDFLRLETFIQEHQTRKVQVNLSTGARQTAFQLFHWASEKDYECFVIDDDDLQHWIWPTSRQPNTLADLANLKSYFRIHQISLLKSGLGMPITIPLRNLVQSWGAASQDYHLFRSLNWLASSARLRFDSNHNQIYFLDLKENWQQHKLFPLLMDLDDLELIQCNHSLVTFAHEASRFFCNGGWLELYVYEQVNALKHTTLPLIQDTRLGLEVAYSNGVKNELDVVFLANNQLHLIEVKSSYLSDKASNANQTIYKLEALSNALGQEVKGMLVSLFDIPKSTHKRAGIYDLKVIDGSQVKQLKHHLQTWINE